MTNARIMRPKLNRLVEAIDKKTARLRSRTSKDNISCFFAHLYQTIYGGRVLVYCFGRNHHPRKGYSFSPDIKRQEDSRWIYTEIKATSTKSSKISSPSTQEGNNLAEMVRRAEKGEHPLPMVEYGLFRYGPRRIRDLHKLDNSQLVRALAASEKKLVISPLNGLLFLASFARPETRNQENSDYGTDEQDYHVIRGSVLTSLLNNRGSIPDLSTGHMAPILEKLCLEDIEVKNSMTPRVEGFYIKPFFVEPFPVTEYFVPEEKYGKLMRSLVKHREELTMAIGIPDVLRKIKDKKEREREERKRRLAEKLKNIPF